jgi:hypothetical protein
MDPDEGGRQIFATVGTGGVNLYPFTNKKNRLKKNKQTIMLHGIWDMGY